MSWEIVVIIAIAAAVLLSVPILFLMWKIVKRALTTFDDVHQSINRIGNEDPFERLDTRVKKMTGPTRSGWTDHLGSPGKHQGP